MPLGLECRGRAALQRRVEFQKFHGLSRREVVLLPQRLFVGLEPLTERASPQPGHERKRGC